MLATLVSEPFDRLGWVYEEKYDGYRILAYKEGGQITLLSRNDKDRTRTFPGIASAISSLPQHTLLLDGEAVAFDRKRVSRFQTLQQGGTVRYAVFDCLYKDGNDLRMQPLSMRRAVLEDVVQDEKTLLLSRRLATSGLDAYRAAKEKGFEGIVAKDASAPYIEGRSTRWLKVKVHQAEEFVIAGFTEPAGSRQHLGALLLGAYDTKGQLHYVGKVGTGFTRNTLASLSRMLRPLIQTNPSFIDPPREKRLTFLRPKLVAQIAFQEWTADSKLRQPVYLGLRDDKRPDECLLPQRDEG